MVLFWVPCDDLSLIPPGPHCCPAVGQPFPFPFPSSLTSHPARPRDVLCRHVPITTIVPRVQCDDCSIPIACPMNLAMDQYGYMVFRYVLFCGMAGPCRPSVTVTLDAVKCLFAHTRRELS